MDKAELLSRLLVEHGMPTRGFENIERGVRIRFMDNSYVDIMDSGITLLYIARRVGCERVLELRDRIKEYLTRLSALNVIAGIEVLSEGCYLALLRKLDLKISMEQANEQDLSKIWTEYIRTLKLLPLITGTRIS
ncbi:hypothetical protein [Metallosphaera javensis (ex Sakai et al. 2022)]|uniref:hypothetical protein n=1 Tax=Metallosphaera javensis (ex Sakai et al. 2022) TaxID=2775498 RepID=UPI00258FD6D5|nr:MAG: hypothetical protein MjAS7_1040 [Metallosphaera javensis (ex Sakai et al. 2022)]